MTKPKEQCALESLRDPDRYLKVVPAFGAMHLPQLTLKGKWLKSAGFPIDSRVRVIVREECLVVLLDETTQEQAP